MKNKTEENPEGVLSISSAAAALCLGTLEAIVGREQDKSKIIITHPKELTPFCFPIKVDSIREKITSETLEDQIRKLRPVL
jgi:ATP-dependent Lhr-like helicase